LAYITQKGFIMKLLTKLRLKTIFTTIMFAFVLANCAPKPAHAQLTDGQSAVLGGIIGYALGKDKREIQYVPVYPTYVPQAPVFIHPSQVQGYNSTDHGYCAPYLNEAYYQCLGNLQRQRNEAAYQRGLRGY
jgi:hypothetical protein